MELFLTSDDANYLRQQLTFQANERCAVLFGNETARADGTIRLLVREVQIPTEDDYSRRGPIEAELKPQFVAMVTKRARREKQALVFVHSHPGTEHPVFSPTDDAGEEHLGAFLDNRHPMNSHLAMVVSKGGVRARRLGKIDEVRVVTIGSHREVIFDPLAPSLATSTMFERQVRTFGAQGQQALQRLRIAIVGLGGTGSLVAQQLAHLGVHDFILVDPDTLESTNLNRVVNATAADIGMPKVEIAARYIRAVAPEATINCLQGDIVQARTARSLLEADVIFGCTDSHGSRAVMQQLSYQYLITCIDVGTTIAVTDGHINHIYGRVQMLSAGDACFTCSDLLNSNEVRRDMMSEFERQADPYLQGAREPAPAVISLNGTVVSLAITMLLSAITGVPSASRYILYDAVNSALRKVRAKPKENCYICSREGALARGDSWPILARQD
jgi:molybdopterin/thiamine biosynthesis adenylyltransferase